jgi:hypothetical protein
MFISDSHLRHPWPGDLPDGQLMPFAISESRRNVYCLCAVWTGMDKLHTVWTGQLQGQVRVLLAAGPKAENSPLGKSLKPETIFLTSLGSVSIRHVKINWLSNNTRAKKLSVSRVVSVGFLCPRGR